MYLNLYNAMKIKKISQATISKTAECTPRAIFNKMKGKSEWLFSEAVRIHETHFPEYEFKELFKKS